MSGENLRSAVPQFRPYRPISAAEIPRRREYLNVRRRVMKDLEPIALPERSKVLISAKWAASHF